MTTDMQIAAVMGKPTRVSTVGKSGAEAGQFPSVLQTVRTSLGVAKPVAKASAREAALKSRRSAPVKENKLAVGGLRARGAANRQEASKSTHKQTEMKDYRDDASTGAPIAAIMPPGEPVQSVGPLNDGAAEVQVEDGAENKAQEPSQNEGDVGEEQVAVTADVSNGAGIEMVAVSGSLQRPSDVLEPVAAGADDEQASHATKEPVRHDRVEPRTVGDHRPEVELVGSNESDEGQAALAEQSEVQEKISEEGESEQAAAKKARGLDTADMLALSKGAKTVAKHDQVTPDVSESPSAAQQVKTGQLIHWEELAASTAVSMEQASAKGTESDKSAAPHPPAVNGIVTVHETAVTQQASQGAETASPTQELPAFDRHQTLEQIVLGIRGKLDARNGQAEIRLDPPNLGSLHVSVRLENGALTAQFEAGNDLVRDLLNSNIGKLRSVLEGQGITVDRLAVRSGADVTVDPAAERFIGSPNHDGRSAGGYSQDPRQRQRPPEESGQSAFAAAWRQAVGQPIDMVA